MHTYDNGVNPADVAVLIPARDEGSSLFRVAAQCSRYGYHCLVLDGGGITGCEGLAALPGVRVASAPEGVGASVRQGLGWVVSRGYRYVARIDADGQHDPAALPKCIDALREEHDFMVGSRFAVGSPVRGRPPVDRVLLNLAMRQLLGALTGRQLSDVLSGFWVMRAPVAVLLHDAVRTTGYGVTLEALLVLLTDGRFRVSEFVHPAIYGGEVAEKYDATLSDFRNQRASEYFGVLTDAVERLGLADRLRQILADAPGSSTP